MMRTLEIRYPSSMKLSVMQRVYRDGVLDATRSSRQVHGTTMPIGQEYLQLGWFDPDVINSTPQGQIKIFGTAGDIWMKKLSGTNWTAFIDVPKIGELLIGKEQWVMELGCGLNPHSSGGIGPGINLDNKEEGIRVKLSVVVKPLNDEEQQTLLKQSNFNQAFKIEK